jgi:nucleoside-diphosphate-sugar epimerase
MSLTSDTKVLVTGISSFIGAHVADQFLRIGCNVVGTVQIGEKRHHIERYFQKYGSNKFNVQEIGYPAEDDVYDSVVRGKNTLCLCTTNSSLNIAALLDVDIIVHVPNLVTSHHHKNPITHVINPAVNCMTTLLRSALNYGPRVKHVIVTSNLASILHLDTKPGYEYTEADWNDWAMDTVKTSIKKTLPVDPVIAYCASKNQAEHAVWDFRSRFNPHFATTVIIPSYVIGPIIPPPRTSDDAEVVSSVKHIFKYFSGEPQDSRLNSFGGNFVSVVDVAVAHVRAAALGAAVDGERFILAAGPFCFQQLSDILRTNFPEKRNSILEGEPGKYADPTQLINGTKAEAVLGIHYADIEQVILETIESIKNLY